MSDYNDCLRDAISALYQIIENAEKSDQDLQEEINLLNSCIKTLSEG